jgi:hypothetical protein
MPKSKVKQCVHWWVINSDSNSRCRKCGESKVFLLIRDIDELPFNQVVRGNDEINFYKQKQYKENLFLEPTRW